MLNLFETYDQPTQYLLASLWQSGYLHPTVIIEDGGFLPEQVISPLQYFMGEIDADGQRIQTSATHKPRYFNQVPFPKYWELSANNNSGEIMDYDKLRAKIFFHEPKHKRYVSDVEWVDDAGKVRLVDGYNQYGRKYRETTYLIAGKPTVTRYFHIDGGEAVVLNHITGDYIVNYQGKIRIFHEKLQYLQFFIQEAGYDLDKLFINSLAVPFLVANRVNEEGENVLFWQERFYDELPGNMEVLLSGGLRTGTVIVPDRKVYERGIELASDGQKEHIHKLGYVYNWTKENKQTHNILILTNSDQIANLDVLVQRLPEATFYIAALTEMSSKLMAYGQYENVKLYPNVKEADVDKLFNTCDIYLDINYGGEILQAAQRAYLAQMVLMGFKDTVHNAEYISDLMVFEKSDVDGFIGTLKELFLREDGQEGSGYGAQVDRVNQRLHEQKEGMNAVTADDYRALLGEPEPIEEPTADKSDETAHGDDDLGDGSGDDLGDGSGDGEWFGAW